MKRTIRCIAFLYATTHDNKRSPLYIYLFACDLRFSLMKYYLQENVFIVIKDDAPYLSHSLLFHFNTDLPITVLPKTKKCGTRFSILQKQKQNVYIEIKSECVFFLAISQLEYKVFTLFSRSRYLRQLYRLKTKIIDCEDFSKHIRASDKVNASFHLSLFFFALVIFIRQNIHDLIQKNIKIE